MNQFRDEVKFPLSNGKYCSITFPRNISKDDFAILKRWIQFVNVNESIMEKIIIKPEHEKL